MNDYRKKYPEFYENKTVEEQTNQDSWMAAYDEHRKQKGMKLLCEIR